MLLSRDDNDPSGLIRLVFPLSNPSQFIGRRFPLTIGRAVDSASEGLAVAVCHHHYVDRGFHRERWAAQPLYLPPFLTRGVFDPGPEHR